MDVFSRTFLSTAREAGVAISTLGRQLPVLRRCVDAGEAVLMVGRCTRPGGPVYGEYLLVLTSRRLIVTRQSRLLHRLRLHLNAELRHLDNITWNPDPRTVAVEFAATAMDGIRERFLIKVRRPRQVWQLDAVFSHLFRPRPTVSGIDLGSAAPAPIRGPARLAPAVAN